MKKDNSISVLTLLLKHLEVKVTSTSIAEELEKHPDHPSLFAINDVLNHWRVPNEAFKIDFEDLQEVPGPFLVHMSSNQGEFAVLHNLNDGSIYLSNERWTNHKMNIDEFKRYYTGNVLVAEADSESGETAYIHKKRAQLINSLRYPLLIGCAMVLLIISLLKHSEFINTLSWQTIALALTKISGLITSILLLIHSIDSNNPFTERLCTGEKNNCNAILSSEAAKVTQYLTWSEVGFFYFSGSCLALLFNTQSSSLLQSLAVMNLLCLPYTFYSIYYQWKVAKQWCVFCTTVQALLWVEFFAFIPYLLKPVVVPELSDVSALLICFLLPVILWIFLKPFLLKSIKIAPLKEELKQFKYNSKLFNETLKEQKRQELLHESDTIILGNAEAENTITIVSNPYCQPCSKAHKVLNEWLSEKESFKLQFVFTGNNDDKDPRTKVARHLHQLDKEDTASVKRAMHDWYEHKYKSFESWVEAYPVRDHGNFPCLEKQKAWCDSARIEGTPTIFLNGYQLPGLWQLEDIKYFI